MSTTVKMLSKAVVERRRVYLDYTCWLSEHEMLTDFQGEVQPYTEANPLVIDTSYPDAAQKKLMVYIAGGVANTDYRVSMTIRTDNGQVKRDQVGLRVVP